MDAVCQRPPLGATTQWHWFVTGKDDAEAGLVEEPQILSLFAVRNGQCDADTPC